MPSPASFAKSSWEQEVSRGFEFYRESGRVDLFEPSERDVVAWFKAQAPEALKLEEPPAADHPLPVRFRRQVLPLEMAGGVAAVSSLLWQLPDRTKRGDILVTEMFRGDIVRLRLDDPPIISSLGNVGNPAHIGPADLDGDGHVDYIVSDLGSFFPQDHDRGRVVWLHEEGTGGWRQEVLASGLGRVAQTADGDFDGDGDTDVLVAEFGWHKTGKILLLRRSGELAGVPQFETVVLDPRHGASHIPLLDWEQDGDLDFVALITQEHERVELFLNDGQGKFETRTIFAAPDPAFGSSGIELVDLDGDGDRDVLYTNGDSMDSAEVKPFHAVRWLENRGQFPFFERMLTPLPGAYKAIAADFDADGDLDVVALAFPPEGKRVYLGQHGLSLMVFLEQTERGKFVRHVMETTVGGAALVAADFDGDGDLDLASAAFAKEPEGEWISLWWNEGRIAARSAGSESTK